MTVLRSREVKSVLVEPVSRNNSPNSINTCTAIKRPRVSSIEPKTPCVTRETQSTNASNSSTPVMDTSFDTSRSDGVRRSLRLASKNRDSSDCVKSGLISSRKRKSGERIEEDLRGSGFKMGEGGVELEVAVVEDSLGSGMEEEGGSGGHKMKVGLDVEGGVELDGGSENGEELELAVVEDSLEGDSGGEVLKKGKGKRKLGFGSESLGEGEGDGGCLRLRSGKKVGGVRGFVDKVEMMERDTRGDDDSGKCGGEGNAGQGDLKLSGDDEMEVSSGKVEVLPGVDQGPSACTGSISDKGKGKGKFIDMVVESEVPKVEVFNSDNDAVKKDGSQVWKNFVTGNHATADIFGAIMAKRNKGSKGNEIDAWDAIISKCVEGMMAKLSKAENGNLPRNGKERARDGIVGPFDVGKRRLSRQEKGKRKFAEIVVESEAHRVDVSDSSNIAIQNGTPEAPKVDVSDSSNVVIQDGMPEPPRGEISNGDTVGVQDGAQVHENDVGDHVTRTRDRFRAQARRSASRFAFFSTTEDEQNHVVDEAETEMDSEREDWPGPFSTAMKIIKERGKNVNLQHKKSSSEEETSQVMWVPKQEKNRKRSNFLVPMLQELCMTTLTKNADAISSLEYVPDLLRHKLSHMLCNMRRMNSHFLELLVRGSPTEIRIRDCSWLSEEDFTKIFAGADINKLAVLQLDQCGRCMPDYIIYATLGRSPNCLPLLTTLSLKGACRLSDIGLSSLLSSAPALRSLNLCQCSLLTSGGINSIADSLGSVLKELYLDDCESIDPFLMLPALSKLEYLEVLSLAGLHTVCDDFICQLIALRGHKLKELVLADCVNLTDVSLKVISRSCPGICALDLTNLNKLTDSALGYLANGCQFIRSLKFRRNIFSDEAVAAYLETSGGSLEELSLNNVSKVAYNTAISLSKCSMNLQNLDLSFCRNLSNEAVGLIADSCLSLKTLKLFGCTQITDVFLDGHSNEQVRVIGLQMTPILGHIKVPELVGPLRYSSASSL